jgi:hypothetical protein
MGTYVQAETIFEIKENIFSLLFDGNPDAVHQE